MTFSAQQNEKRKHRRYRISNNGLVVVNPGGLRSNKIINISNGGMAFNYQSTPHSFIPEGSLDVLIPDFVKLFQLNRLRFSTVYDQPIPCNGYDSDRTMRRQGVKFEGLTGEQNNQLLNVLKYHATVEDGDSHAKASKTGNPLSIRENSLMRPYIQQDTKKVMFDGTPPTAGLHLFAEKLVEIAGLENGDRVLCMGDIGPAIETAVAGKGACIMNSLENRDDVGWGNNERYDAIFWSDKKSNNRLPTESLNNALFYLRYCGRLVMWGVLNHSDNFALVSSRFQQVFQSAGFTSIIVGRVPMDMKEFVVATGVFNNRIKPRKGNRP